MADESILIEDDGTGIRTLILNRPEKLNAWDSEMRRRLRDAVEAIPEDRDIRVLIITGAGRAFSAGEDVSGMEDLAKGGTRRFRAVARTIHSVFDLIESLEIPVIAAVNGVAAGGGCELALSCDFRVMAHGSRLVLPEGKVGLIPGSGGCSRLVKHVGLARAKEMVMLGRSIQPDLARQIGLATEITPAGEAVNGARELAAQLCGQAPLALGMAKIVLNTCVDVDHETGRRLERLGQSVLKTSEDHLEAASAFLEKRQPNFTGR
jgi:enoyl-CoA hydratase